MAEKHYVDAKDQHIAAEGAPTHSELSTLYPGVTKEEKGPWMQEDERQAAMEKDRHKIISGLRKSAVLIGFCISLPVVLGIILGQLLMTSLTPNNVMAYVFLMVLFLGGFVLMTFFLYKWVGQTFRIHALRALPITLTTLLSLLFIAMPVFRMAEAHIGGLVGYGVGLLSLLVIGIFIATISIFVWTSAKIHDIGKILVLAIFFGGAVAAAYLL